MPYTPNVQTADLTVPEAADVLQVARRTVRAMIDRGSLPGAYRLDPSCRSVWRIPRKDIDEILNARHQNIVPKK